MRAPTRPRTASRATDPSARGRRIAVVAASVAVIGYLVTTLAGQQLAGYDRAATMLVAPVLVVVGLAGVAHVRRVDRDPYLVGLVAFSMVGFTVAALVHHHVAFETYAGESDAELYARQGALIAERLAAGDLTPNLGGESLVGLGFTYLLTGAVHLVVGPSTTAAFLIFGMVAFWGCYLCVRAFRVALPEADVRRYATLLLLFPSVLFWGGGIGKEPWMLLCIGATALGAARLFAHRPRAIPVLLAGLVGTSLIRPHITLMLFGALALALLIASWRRTTPSTPVVRAGLLGALAIAGWLLLDRVFAFLQDNGTAPSSLLVIHGDTALRSGGGGSGFTDQAVHGIADLPVALVTVLFRPFPWEASGLAMVSAVEGLALILLTVTAWRRWTGIPGLLRPAPYVAFSLVFVLGFVVAFSAVANFGGLVRERIMVLPFLLVLLCLPVRPRRPAPP